MISCLAAGAVVLSVGIVGSAARAGAASGDVVVIGDTAVAPPTGVSTLPGRLATTVTWDAASSQPGVGYRVYDTTGGQRTLVAGAGKAETSVIVPGSGARSLALVAADDTFAESPDVVLGVPAVTSEVVTNDWYGVSRAHATDLPGARPRPTGLQRVSLDPSRRLWVGVRYSSVSVCQVDSEVCTPVPGTSSVSGATAPKEAVWLPDGTIAFIRRANSGITLWVVRQDGSGLRQVAALPRGEQLTAAPSGAEVLLHDIGTSGSVGNLGLPQRLERVRLSDGLKTTVPLKAPTGNFSPWFADFSVSSRGLLVVGRSASHGTVDVRLPRTTTVMNLDGSGARVLPLPAGDNRNVTFDPTGTKVAFSVFTSDLDSRVWVANADGSSAHATSGAVNGWIRGLVWSVDNRASPSASLGGPTYSGPDVTVTVGAADSDDPVGSLRRECRIDAATEWTACPASLVLRGLAAGNHTVYARVTDPSGRQSAIVSRTWPLVTRLSDFNRDGRTDLVARDSAGKLWLYPGSGASGFLPRRPIGAGWNIYSAILSPGDVTGDGKADILARDAAGLLWLYTGNGASGVNNRRVIGKGWNIMTAITGAGDMTGDGRSDILARDTAGTLWLYPMVANGAFQARRAIGAGWNIMATISGTGDSNGDTSADILARDNAGQLWLYRGNGVGAVSNGIQIGKNWHMMNTLATLGNWDGAGGNDVLARDGAGALWLYPGNNAGAFGARRQIGSGWNIMTYIG